VPPLPGIYGWFFSELPPGTPATDCITSDGRTLLYVGISPTERRVGLPPSGQNLRVRLRQHFRGNAASSTLRLTLGCLLARKLGIALQRDSDRYTFGNEELVLSNWMGENAFVRWQALDKPWLLENQLISEMSLPLNLRGNEDHEFHASLTQLRRAAKASARANKRPAL
jgi:hypothetical protein